jgi:hypothetical protein
MKKQLFIPILALTCACFLLQPATSMAAGNSKSQSSDSPFIGQTQIAATIMQLSRPVGVFQVDVGILVTNTVQRQRAVALMPVLRDAWRRTTQEFANRYLISGRVPDAVLLAQRLQAATDQVLGTGTARLLLISVIVR